MAYKYDPILCMMVEQPNVKTNDEKKTFIVNIYVDGKNVKFASSAMSANGAILEARKKYPQGLVWGVDRATAKDESIKTEDADTLKKGQVYRNANGVRVEIISVEPNYVLVNFGGQMKDFTPFGLQKILSDNGYKKVKDAKVRDENYLISGMKSQLEQTLKRYKDPKNKNKLVSQYIGFVNNHRVNGKVTEKEYNEFVKYAKSLVGGSAGARDVKTADVDANVAMQILSNSKDFYNKYISMIEKAKDEDTITHIANMAERDFDRMIDNLDRMLNMFQRQFAEARNSVLKYKADTDKAAFKKYHAVSKGR